MNIEALIGTVLLVVILGLYGIALAGAFYLFFRSLVKEWKEWLQK